VAQVLAMLVVVAQVLAMLVVVVEVAVSLRARSALLAALVAVGAALALGPCHMWEVVRASTSKRPLTSMLGVAAISMPSAPEGISHASLQAAC